MSRPYSFWRHLILAKLRRFAEVLLIEGRGTLHLLRWVGVLVVLWYERLTFLQASLQCLPPRRVFASSATFEQKSAGVPDSLHTRSLIARNAANGTEAGQRVGPPEICASSFSRLGRRAPTRSSTGQFSSASSSLVTMQLTILADPQLVDRQSYSHLDRLPMGLNHVAYALVRWAADTYARKCYDAVIRSQGRMRSDAVIWLGDLLDGGRRPLATYADVRSFERHVLRFRKLFRQDVPSIYLPGNHDVRIPLTHNERFNSESRDSRSRWLQTWGTWYDREHARFAWSLNDDGPMTGVQLDTSYSAEATPQAQGMAVANRKAVLRAKTARKVIIWPPGGPQWIAVESSEWHRTVNARIPLFLDGNSSDPTHELLFVDALELAGMVPANVASTTAQDDRDEWSQSHVGPQGDAMPWWNEARRRFAKTLDFVESLQNLSTAAEGERISTAGRAQEKVVRRPVRILFSHIPLWRPPNTACSIANSNHRVASPTAMSSVVLGDQDWHREARGNIEQGADQYATYQNMLSKPVTDWLLRRSEPTLIFSGDNHDHCHVVHPLSVPRLDAQPGSTGGSRPPSATISTAEELTLKAFSMTGGVRRPGFARLALSFDAHSAHTDVVAKPCNLPDQVAIWTLAYPIWLLMLLITLWIDRRWRTCAWLDKSARNQYHFWSDHWYGGLPTSRQGHPKGRDGEHDDETLESIQQDVVDLEAIQYGRRLRQNINGRGAPHSGDGPQRRVEHANDRSAANMRIQRRGRHDQRFAVRARRELLRASLAGEKVHIGKTFAGEGTRVLLLPMLLWFFLQL